MYYETIQIDFNSDEAIYIQLRNQIILGIATSRIQEGDTLPSVRQLADNIGINMHTVNKAYSVLRQEGLLSIDRRKGAVISINADKLYAMQELREDLQVILAKAVCKNSIMREGYTSQAKKALAYAVRTAEKCGHNYVGTEHLLIGLLNVEDGTAGMVLSEFHVDAGQLTELIDRLIAPGGNTVTESRPGYTPRVRRVLENAEAEAARFKSRAVGTEHLLIAILKESDCVATRLLFTMGINIQKLYGAILTAMGEAPLQGGASGNANTGRGPQTRGGAQTSETPALDQYSRDLTELAREGKLDPVVGRGQEIERVIQILSRRTKNNPCLIGEPGVGKTAIAEGLAQRIALGIVPETIRDKRVVVLDLSGMVAGSKYRGEFEERIKRVVKEVTDNENILLFIDELHTIIGAGGAEGALDASNILKPSLSRGEIQLIGATTLEEYRKSKKMPHWSAVSSRSK